jgi:PAS domain-containing protein
VLLLRGSAQRIEYINAAAQQLFPGRQLFGRPIAESQPESVAQGFVALLDRVYQTGETYLGTEVQLTVQHEPGQPARTRYFNFSYQAYREQGQVLGVSSFAYDVTEQVLARA